MHAGLQPTYALKGVCILTRHFKALLRCLCKGILKAPSPAALGPRNIRSDRATTISKHPYDISRLPSIKISP